MSENAVLIIAITVLIIFMWGEPSLLEAIIQHIGECRP